MPVDYPDFGAHEEAVAYPLMGDLGELAVRLGSINSYDRRGSVVAMDDFESPILNWDVSVDGLGSYVCLDSPFARSGCQQLKVHIVNDVDAGCELTRYFTVLASKRLGVEFSFAHSDVQCYERLDILYHDGAFVYRARVQLDSLLKELSIWNEAGAWQKVADIPLLASNLYLHHTIKLVLDFNTLKYQRVMLNLASYDLSSYAFQTVAPTTASVIQLLLAVYPIVATGNDVYIDDFILTQDEP